MRRSLYGKGSEGLAAPSVCTAQDGAASPPNLLYASWWKSRMLEMPW
ncbi:MAG TPA: hypothetical protein VEI45_19460 [Mycobacterium sp.]|nr:hypothetical protein [Mycobacterium sp.]HXY66473.1 hypothetical protein [Mycobacterium sp.]